MFITSGAEVINDDDVCNLSQSLIIGLGRVIAIEHPELHCKRIDIDDDADFQDSEFIETLFNELNVSTSNQEDQVAFRDGIRYVPRLSRSVSASEINPYTSDTYLGFSSRGVIDNLIFKQLNRREPKNDEVEIEVLQVV